MPKDADVIVIGSGPIGAIAARKIAEKGRKVLILEAGKALSNPPGSHLRNQKQFQKDPDKFFIEALQNCEFYNEAAPPEGLPGACKTEAIGGQGILWTNNCPRPTPYIEEWNKITSINWEKRLSEAEKLLQVHTHFSDQSFRQSQIQKRLPVEKLPLAAQKVSDGTLHYTAPRDILKEVSNIQIESDTKISEIHHQKGTVTAVSSTTKKFSADQYIVCAGPFDTAKLLFNSKVPLQALGKYLHYHPLIVAQLILDESFCASNEVDDPPPRLYIPPSPAKPWHLMLLRDTFPTQSSEHALPNRLIEIQCFAPLEVRKENRMHLESSSPTFSVTQTDQDKKIVQEMRQEIESITKILGRYRKGCEPTFAPIGLAHPMGTCRMGNDPKSSVTGPSGNVHGFDNLFLAGSSLIPFSFAMNPTLTSAALAIETVDRLFSRP